MICYETLRFKEHKPSLVFRFRNGDPLPRVSTSELREWIGLCMRSSNTALPKASSKEFDYAIEFLEQCKIPTSSELESEPEPAKSKSAKPELEPEPEPELSAAIEGWKSKHKSKRTCDK